MEENQVHSFIAMEVVESKRGPIRSAGVLYAVLLLLVLGIIAAGNALSAVWPVPRVFVQITLYILLLVIGWYVYRYLLTSFRYTLTDRVFAVERVVGKKERADVGVHLVDIIQIIPAIQINDLEGKSRNLSARSKKDSVAVVIRAQTGNRIFIVSPSAEFLEQLKAQWKIARK
jgi:hypothetical protein